MTDWALSVAREFSRERLTPQLAIALAQEAFKAGRLDDGKRLIDLAYELLDFTVAHTNREV